MVRYCNQPPDTQITNLSAEGIIQSDDEDEVNDDGEYELAAALTGPVPPVIAVLCVRQRPVEELLRANDVWAMSRSVGSKG